MENFKLRYVLIGILLAIIFAVPMFIGTVVGIILFAIPIFLMAFSCETVKHRVIGSILLCVYLGIVFWGFGWPATFINFLPSGWLWQMLYGFITIVVLALFFFSFVMLIDYIIRKTETKDKP